MNTLYEMLDIDIPVRLEDGVYFCGDNIYRNQEYAKKVMELQQIVDSLERNYELLTMKERYLKCEQAIFLARQEQDIIKEEFKEYVEGIRNEKHS